MCWRLFLIKPPQFLYSLKDNKIDFSSYLNATKVLKESPKIMPPYNRNKILKDLGIDFDSFLKSMLDFRHNSNVTKMMETLVEERRKTFDMFVC